MAISELSISLDVLVLGGGVQGLWILNDLLQEGYHSLLLETGELGGDQTCHSHAYIHHGHVFGTHGLAKSVKEVHQIWTEWLTHHPIHQNMDSYFGFANPAEADKREHLWNDPLHMLPFSSSDLPLPLAGGHILKALKMTGVCLDAEELVKALVTGTPDHISKIKSITDIASAGGRISWVTANVDNNTYLRLQPRALILAAGRGNTGLHQMICGKSADDCCEIRTLHMLVVRAKNKILDPLAGFFHPSKLFIVPRQVGEDIVWLVSDTRHNPDRDNWVQTLFPLLVELAPRYFRDPTDLLFGIYEAVKCDGRGAGDLPAGEQLVQFGFQNLWAVWPTKLTLAPRASRSLRSLLRTTIGPPTNSPSFPPGWTHARVQPAIAKERWRVTPLLPWNEFQVCYHL
ncbi:MAG TPA: FAD-dependent oxidoreductase [Thermoanaerobaculia bacterium]|jgi:hypothetical protein